MSGQPLRRRLQAGPTITERWCRCGRAAIRTTTRDVCYLCAGGGAHADRVRHGLVPARTTVGAEIMLWLPTATHGPHHYLVRCDHCHAEQPLSLANGHWPSRCPACRATWYWDAALPRWYRW